MRMTDAPTPPPLPPYEGPAVTPAPHAVPAGWHLDHASGRQRWWDGTKWTENFAPAAGAQSSENNGFATAALVLGILGFLLTPIPFFIGLFLGGPLDILGIIFGIIGIMKANRIGKGSAASIWGLVLSALAFVSIFLGAGTIW